MKIVFDIIGMVGLFLNMIGTILIIKSSPFKDVKTGISSLTFGDSNRARKERIGLQVIFLGFLFQFISAFCHLYCS